MGQLETQSREKEYVTHFCTLLHIDAQYPDIIQRFIILVCLRVFDHGTDIHSLGDSPKDSMLIVQPRSRDRRDED